MLSGMRNAGQKPESLEERLEKRIARKRGDVFLRADFGDLGGYDQVGRALRGLVRKGRLMKVGYGLYARARPSPFTTSRSRPKGLRALAGSSQRLGVEMLPTRLEQATMTARPHRCRPAASSASRGRVRRQIGYNGFI